MKHIMTDWSVIIKRDFARRVSASVLAVATAFAAAR
jgi:hypothetical protein